jgi:hypothetical protein
VNKALPFGTIFGWKHVLGLRGSVAQASLLDELGLQPLHIIWLKAFVRFFATASTAMGGHASKCGAVKGLSQGLVCTASLVSEVYWCTEL